MKINCKVVMLATHKASVLFKNEKDTVLLNTTPQFSTDLWKAQRLFFVSSEQIKNGDLYIICDESTSVHKAAGMPQNWYSEMCMKIVASTDRTLGLPIIPNSFLEKYVNLNGEIRSVNIKADWVNSDNEVAIFDEKETWTKFEIESLLESCWLAAIKKTLSPVDEPGYQQWLQENL